MVRARRDEGFARCAVPAALAAGAAVRLGDGVPFLADALRRIELAMMMNLPEALQTCVVRR